MGMNGVPVELYLIPPAERQLYDNYFAQLKSKDGFIDSQTARDFFSKSQLPKNVLANIWMQADRTKDGRLDRNEFAVAMHITRTATHQSQGGFRPTNGSFLPRPGPTLPVNFGGIYENRKKSSAEEPIPQPMRDCPNGNRRKSWVSPAAEESVPPPAWDFSRYAMTSPARQQFSLSTSVFPAPKSSVPSKPDRYIPPSGSQSAFLVQKIPWPTKNHEAPSKSTQFKKSNFSPKSKYHDFVLLKRRELQDLKAGLETARRTKPVSVGELSKVNQEKSTLSSSVSSAKKLAKQTEEFLEKTNRQAGVIQSANVLLERQEKKLRESVKKEREDRVEANLPEVSGIMLQELRHLDSSIAETILRQKRLAIDLADRFKTTIRLENIFADKERRLNNLFGRLEKCHNDHKKLLEEFSNKQQLVQRYSSCSVRDSVDFSSPSPPEFESAQQEAAVFTALAAFLGSSENELPFEQGDALTILQKNDDGWWLALDAAGQVGHVPASFFQINANTVSDQPDATDFSQNGDDFHSRVLKSPSQTVEYAVALYSYTAANSDELSFSADDIIEIFPTQDADPDWLLGKLVGSQAMGLVPANYLKFDQPESEVDESVWTRRQSVHEDEPIRRKAIEELVETEEKYLADITAVMEIFHAKLRSSGVLSETVLQAMFFVWPDLIDSSTAFLSVLRNPGGSGYQSLTRSIGGILCAHFPKQGPYVVFCSNQVKISELIREKTAENTRLDEILRACSQEVRLQGLPLTTAYVKPMQRITRYPLLIKRIFELTPETHPDYENLRLALAQAENLCRKVNEKVREAENVERFAWLQKHVNLEEFADKIKFDSATNFMGPRNLLYSGSLVKSKGGREMVTFLFNDFFLFTTPPRGATISSLGNFSFDKRQWMSQTPLRLYRKPYLLANCTIAPAPDGGSFHITFPLAATSFTLKAITCNEGKAWIRKIQEAAYDYAKGDHSALWRSMVISQPPVIGCCRVIVMEALELKEKRDSFCKVSLGEQERKTKVVEHSSEPKWDQNMTFNIHSLDRDVLTLTVWSYSQFAPNGFLGRAELHLGVVLMESKGVSVPVIKRLLLGGVASGEVVLKVDIQVFPVNSP